VNPTLRRVLLGVLALTGTMTGGWAYFAPRLMVRSVLTAISVSNTTLVRVTAGG
jgi:hypothetical protein